MKKPETAVVGKIMDYLQSDTGYWVKIHGGPYQVAGIPDIIGCYQGRFVAIEVKFGTNGPTKLQEIVLGLIAKAGGRCGVAYTLEDALRIRDGL